MRPFLDLLYFHAEGAAAFAFALFGIDPALVKGAFGERFKLGGEFAKVPENEITRFLERIDLIRFAMGAKISTRQVFLADLLALA